MTEVLQRSPSHFPSPSSSSIPNDGSHPHSLLNSPAIVSEEEEEEEEDDEERKERDREGDQLSLLTFLVAAFRKSLIGCSTTSEGKLSSMEIGWPSNVRHVAHVTFDRFNGFLGLPAEYEPEVPRRAPSASASVFGVSTESMQLSFDSRGNSVPTILLLMQRHLYVQGGLEAEGIFRITAGNSQEEYVRDQLNRGVIPEGVDVHCLAGLIKAWFRELPTGVLDSLSPEQVMESQTEEECGELVKLLPPTEAALLDWAINLMADVAQFEHLNKMNARNVAMVFAPNMTQMTDPLTALMYAVQVMNFLRTLITKTLKEREDGIIEDVSLPFHLEPSDDNGHQSSSWVFEKAANEEDEDKENRDEQAFVEEEPNLESSSQLNLTTGDGSLDHVVASDESGVLVKIQPLMNHCPCSDVGCLTNGVEERFGGQSSHGNLKKGLKKKKSEKTGIHLAGGVGEKSRRVGILSRINSRIELAEVWR